MVLGSKYKPPRRQPDFVFSLNHFYFCINKGEILIYQKKNEEKLDKT
jgi:hypothetical protein